MPYETNCLASVRTDSFDSSFLGCEDRNGWVSIHHRTALTGVILTGSPFGVLAGATYWEWYEAFSLNTLRSYVVVSFDLLDNESTIGSLADVVFAGTIGVLLAVKICQLVDFTGMVKHYNRMSWHAVVRIGFFGLLHEALYCLHTLRTASGFRIGSWALLIVEMFWILGVYPAILRADDLPGRNLAADYGKVKWLWAFIDMALALTGLSAERPLVNNWYLTWLISFTCLGALLLCENWLKWRQQPQQRRHHQQESPISQPRQLPRVLLPADSQSKQNV
jgi:hypothetical protein